MVGNPDLVPAATAERLAAAAAGTDGRTGMQVNAAVGYGGRQEIADAVRKLLLRHAEAGTSIEELAEVLDVDHIAEHLYTSGQPDPDLVIRTSGEQRLSGFLMWQSVYSEFYFTEAFWPQFRADRLPARAARLLRPSPALRRLNLVVAHSRTHRRARAIPRWARTRRCACVTTTRVPGSAPR